MSRLAELELALATGRISEALLSEESAAGQSAAWRAALTMARTFGSSGDYVALLRRVEEGAVAAEAVGAAGAAGGAAAAAVAALFGAPLAPSSEGERCDGFDELCGALAARAGAFVRGDGDDDEARQLRAFAVLLVGASLLSLFVQMNYTGPLLQTEDLVGLIPSLALFAPRDADAPAAPAKTSELHEDEDAHDEPVAAATLARALLCVDGEPVYVLAKWPSLILCARATLVALTRVLDADASANGAAADALCTARWWCARAIVVHHELIVSQLCEGSDTLREAATALFAAACAHPRVAADGAPHLADVARATARATLWLERGLALQVASHAEDASRCFDAAKLHAGLDCELTGITGRGTKFQKFDRAQLVLNTRSALAVYDAATVAAAAVATAAADDDGAAADDDDDDAPTIDGSVAAAALPPAPQQPSSAGRSNNRMREVTLGECSFIYRYISRESCSQFDSLPLTSLTISKSRSTRTRTCSTFRACARSPMARSWGRRWTRTGTCLAPRWRCSRSSSSSSSPSATRRSTVAPSMASSTKRWARTSRTCCSSRRSTGRCIRTHSSRAPSSSSRRRSVGSGR